MHVLGIHSTDLFSNLIYQSDVISDNLKEVEFDGGYEAVRGYFARKNKIKYWLDEKLFDMLPIRLGDNNEEMINKEDVVIRPLNPIPFKITPKHTMDVRTLVDEFAPFEHSHPENWKLLKFIALMGFVSRTFVCVSSKSHFGKSSLFDLIHYLTDKSPVFKPRSVPGVLNQINEIGNMVFDETHRCKKEVRDIIEEFALQIGSGKSLYINGALKSTNTKPTYDCVLQSITFLYNNTDNYNNPEKDYFEFIFSNNKAIDDRFLKIKVDGILTENFTKDFDMPKVARENRMYYIQVAKELLYLQKQKLENKYQRKYVTHSTSNLKGRKLMIFNDITWMMDMYASSQDEYDEMVKLFDNCIFDYKEMVGFLNSEKTTIEEEEIK